MSKSNVDLRRIDVRDWSSPVAAQYAIRGLPTLHLYDGTARIATDTRQVIERVSAAQ